MKYFQLTFVAILLAALFVLPLALRGTFDKSIPVPANRSEVVFWHFWGGEDRDVVDDVVARFNESQTEYFVRAIAMPGNNLQAKLFLSVAGGDPPDIVNQDDPILADWGQRGVIYSMDEIAPANEVQSVRDWMLDSATRLSVYDDRMFGVCNGLDVRALYYNQTALEQLGHAPPKTLDELDAISNATKPFTSSNSQAEETTAKQFAYLPDSRRLWAWGYVFGGDFYEHDTATVRLNTPEIQNALQWMVRYSRSYGWENIAAFRKGDQSLPGKTFPLLPIADDQQVGRYSLIMDGQWRVRNINAFQKIRRERGLTVPEFGVCPLPIPSSNKNQLARTNAGWVNGNFFVVPRGAKNSAGAWEFAKFWIGYSDPAAAAKTCADGGWIPVSNSVIQSDEFQDYLGDNPLFKSFVELATSENQFPVPQVVGAAMFRRTVEQAAYEAMANPEKPVETILAEAESRIQAHLDRVRSAGKNSQGAAQ